MSVSIEADREVFVGQRVQFTHALRRDKSQRVNRWVREAHVGENAEPLSAVIVGRRTLANGTAEWDDGYSYFIPSEHVVAYLVSFNLHRKPVHVLPEDVIW